MYYIALVIVIVMVALWKRDMRETKAAYLTIIGELKSERMEFDKLMEKYMVLLKEQGARPGKSDKSNKAGKRKSRAADSNVL